jgi:putative toxin-antitoxin system antitoxin component (TIGR02293 family)
MWPQRRVVDMTTQQQIRETSRKKKSGLKKVTPHKPKIMRASPVSVKTYRAQRPKQENGVLRLFSESLGVPVKKRSELIGVIKGGFKVSTFNRLAKEMSLSGSELATAVGIKPRTLTRRQKTGRLSPDESDRLVRLASLYAKTEDLFEGDKEKAARWFMTEKRALGGAAPIDYADTEIGVQEVEDLIGRLEHGIFS